MLKMKPVFLLLLILTGLIFSGIPAAAQDDNQTVPVEKGEILLYIAIRLNVSPECIREANDLPNLMAVPDDVTELKIPIECASTTTSASTASTTTSTAPASDASVIADQTYTVKSGDRLFKIADQFGTTATCIAEANNIANANLIYVGQQLLITASCQGSGGGAAPVSSVPGGQNAGCQFDRNSGRSAPDGQYTVQAGDSLDFIACDFGVSLECLTNANPQLDNRGQLAIGDTVTIDQTCPGWEAWPGTGSADTP